MTEEHKQKIKESREAAKFKKEEEVKKVENLEARVTGLADSIEKIGNLLTKDIEVSDHRPAVQKPSLSEQVKNEVTVPEDSEGYFPPKFRRMIDKILGPDFKAALAESSGSDCILKVFVPTQWDCRLGDQRLMGTYDIRVGIVHKATDLSDVEKWCTLFAANIKKTYPQFISPKV